MIHLDEEDDYDEPEHGWDDDDETVPCPHCREPVYEDAERCPHCGRYLSREDAPYRKPWWVVAGVLACLAMVFWWILNP
ncbi:zinc-ribbon domain-containing protein [Tundrisphaera lichenicola]|uniref:zinc-ribbon domain-containing protein n=1 Tax=Tundrisphaera lichenicola TaxID=2029860 RepID=UPI003EBDFFA4